MNARPPTGRRIPGTDWRADNSSSYGSTYAIVDAAGDVVGYARRNSGRFDGHSYTVEGRQTAGTYFRPVVTTHAANLTRAVEWLKRHDAGDCAQCEHSRREAYAARLREQAAGQ